MSHIKRRIVTILKDDELDAEEKVEILRQLEADSLSKERSATEGMTAVDGDDGVRYADESGTLVHEVGQGVAVLGEHDDLSRRSR